MTDLAIRVEQLGKSYRIGHQAGGQRGRYRTLRDDLLARAAWRRMSGYDQMTMGRMRLFLPVEQRQELT